MSSKTAEQEWRDLLSGKLQEEPRFDPLRYIPSNPRCKLCRAPFRAPGALVLRRFGFEPWGKTPRICGRCLKGMENHVKRCASAADDEHVAGAAVELSMLFAGATVLPLS